MWEEEAVCARPRRQERVTLVWEVITVCRAWRGLVRLRTDCNGLAWWTEETDSVSRLGPFMWISWTLVFLRCGGLIFGGQAWTQRDHLRSGRKKKKKKKSQPETGRVLK